MAKRSRYSTVRSVPGFAEFALRKTGSAKPPGHKGHRVHRIHRFQKKAEMYELVAKIAGISPKSKNLPERVERVRGLLSTTHLPAGEIQEIAGEKAEFVAAVDEAFNLRLPTSTGLSSSVIPVRALRLVGKTTRLAPLTQLRKIDRRTGLVHSTYELLRKQSVRGKISTHYSVMGQTSLFRLRRLVYRIRVLNEPVTTSCRKEGFSGSYFRIRKEKSGPVFEKLLKYIEESAPFRELDKRVKAKMAKGLSPEEALSEVESEIFRKRERINAKNTERVLARELGSMQPTRAIRLIDNIVQFYLDFKLRMPEDVFNRIQEFVEKRGLYRQEFIRDKKGKAHFKGLH